MIAVQTTRANVARETAGPGILSVYDEQHPEKEYGIDQGYPMEYYI